MMSYNEQRQVAKMMKLMAEAVELAWKQDVNAALKVSQAIQVARLALPLAASV